MGTPAEVLREKIVHVLRAPTYATYLDTHKFIHSSLIRGSLSFDTAFAIHCWARDAAMCVRGDRDRLIRGLFAPLYRRVTVRRRPPARNMTAERVRLRSLINRMFFVSFTSPFMSIPCDVLASIALRSLVHSPSEAGSSRHALLLSRRTFGSVRREIENSFSRAHHKHTHAGHHEDEENVDAEENESGKEAKRARKG